MSLCALLLAGMPVVAGAEIREGEGNVALTITTREGRVLPPVERTRLRVFVHEDRGSHLTKPPACQVTQDDDMETYELPGWHLPAGGISYVVNLDKAPPEVAAGALDALGRAVATWESVDVDKQLTFQGTTDILRPRYDGNNVINWRRISRRTIAVAYIWYDPSTDEVLDVDMVFNARVPWAITDQAAGDCGGTAGAYDLQAVATHELGHWLGLDDLYDASDGDLTMYGYVTMSELKKATLGRGDALGAQAVAP